jgi:hypothetical protein
MQRTEIPTVPFLQPSAPGGRWPESSSRPREARPVRLFDARRRLVAIRLPDREPDPPRAA